MDRDRLTKLLAMTTSDNDGEALNAMRMANKMVKEADLTWEQVLAAPAMPFGMRITVHGPGPGPRWSRSNDYRPPGSSENWIPPHLQDKVIIDLMFRAVFAQPRSDNEEFWQLMDSIHNRWQQHGNLAQGQYDALKRSYNLVKRA